MNESLCLKHKNFDNNKKTTSTTTCVFTVAEAHALRVHTSLSYIICISIQPAYKAVEYLINSYKLLILTVNIKKKTSV